MKTRINKQVAYERLKHKKIFVGNPEISERVQRQLFKAGYFWEDEPRNTPLNTEYMFLYTHDVDDIPDITVSAADNIDNFISDSFEEITVSEILSWNIVDDKQHIIDFIK